MKKIDWGKVVTSKTLWLNIVAIAIFVVESAQGQVWIPIGYQALILGVFNMIVRFLTNDSLTKPPTGGSATP